MTFISDHWTDETPCDLTKEPGYVVYSGLGSFYIPLAIIIFVYFKIFQNTRRRLRKRAQASNFQVSQFQQMVRLLLITLLLGSKVLTLTWQYSAARAMANWPGGQGFKSGWVLVFFFSLPAFLHNFVVSLFRFLQERVPTDQVDLKLECSAALFEAKQA